MACFSVLFRDQIVGRHSVELALGGAPGQVKELTTEEIDEGSL